MKVLRSIVLVASIVGLVALAAPAASAAPANPPPSGYPSGTVRCSVVDPNDGLTMITRLGYYDSVTDEGFGYDKANTKHGIYDCNAINAILQSPDRYDTSRGKATVNYNQWADQWTNGQLVQELLVTAVYEFGNWPAYYEWPAGNPLGLMTVYCYNSDQSAKCPSWVNDAMANPVASGASRAATSSGGGETIPYSSHYPVSTFRP